MLEWLSQQGISLTGIGLSGTLLQLSLIGLAFILASIAARLLTPVLELRLRRIKENPRLMRVLVLILRRIKWIIFAIILWAIVTIMREVTWYSRSYLVAIAVNLVSAWIVISVVSRMIKNQFVGNVLAIGTWTIAALSILRLLDDATAFLDSGGVDFNGVRLTPLLVLKAVFTITAMIWIALVVGRFVDRKIREVEDLSPSLQMLIGKLSKALLVVTAILASLSLVGIDFTALAVFSGAVGLGLGFGLQKVVSNLVSGVILLMDKSIKPGDVISVGETYGQINELTARYASVISREGKEYLIPNEDLITSQVVNWSYTSDLVRLDLDFGVSYEADPHEVRQLAKDTVVGHPRVQSVPKPVCHITEFADNSVNYKLRFWIRDPDKGTTNIRGDIFLALWDALKEANIDIPYPRRDLAMHGPVRVELEQVPTKQPTKRAPKRKPTKT